MNKLDKAAGAREARGGGLEAPQDTSSARAWKHPPGKAQSRAAGLRLDTLGTLSMLSERSGSIVAYKPTGTLSSTDLAEQASVDGIMEEDKSAHADHDGLMESERESEQETVRMMCAETAKNISEVLGAELRGSLQAALREEVLGAELRGSLQAALREEVLGAELRGGLRAVLKEEVGKAVREEFKHCSRQLREAYQRPTAESSCQADSTTVPAKPGHAQSESSLPWPSGPGHARSDGSLPLPPGPGHARTDESLPWPSGATFPQPKATSLPSLPRMPNTSHQCVPKAARSQRQNLPRPGDEAHDSLGSEASSRPHSEAHRLRRDNSFVSAVSCSGQSSYHEEASIVAIEQDHRGSAEVHELLRQQGLVKYASNAAARTRSESSSRSKAQAGQPHSRKTSRKNTAPPQASERAHLIGVDSREKEEVASTKHTIRLNKKECLERGNFERQVTNEIFRTMDLLPPEDEEKKEGSFSLFSFSRGKREKKHTPRQDAWPLQATGAQYTTEASWQSEQESRCSFPSKWDHAPSKREIEGDFNLATSSKASEEEVVTADISITAANLAMDALYPGLNIEGSLSQSSSSVSCRNWFKFPCSVRVPSIETLRKRRDEELVRKLKLEFGGGEFDDIAPAPYDADDELERRSQLAVWAAKISGLFGTTVAPACAVIPWEPRYPCLSILYQWIILGLVGKCLYRSVTMTYQEWEMGESSKAVVHALDSLMGTGALLTLLACGALWRSTRLVNCCKLLMAYSCKVGILLHWEEVNSTDFFCTVGIWLASVLTVTLESLYFEVFTDMEDLLAHIGCFALFTFILMGMAQFALHMCRFLTKMIDTFCYHTCKQPDWSGALSEWSLMQALCRSVCSNIQCAFVSLQATATAVVLLSIQQVGSHDVSRLMALAPGLIVAMGVFRTSLWAAAVTDKCTRVPMLVNSVTVGSLLDQDRMYAVHYIVYSQAGFYLFELRLTSSAVLKTAYVACAVTFYLASRVFA